MLKKVVCGLLILAILGCFASIITTNAYIYILCFWMVVAAILLGLLMLILNLIWRLLPVDFKEAYEGKQRHFNAIIIFSILLLYITLGVINGVCLLNASGFIKLLGHITTLVFCVFLGWCLIKQFKLETIVACIFVFILIVGALSFISFTTLKSGRIAEVNPTEKLKSLGYVNWALGEENIEKKGVTIYDRELAFDGLNFYNSQVSPEAYLLDMHGNILHKWAKRIKGCDDWTHHAELCDNGDLLVVKDPWLIRLDWDSKVKWKKRIPAHHDIAIDKNGDLYVFAQKRKLMFWRFIPIPIVVDYIAVLSPKGNVREEVCLYKLLKENVPMSKITMVYAGLLKLLKPTNMLILCKNILIHFRLNTSAILGVTHFDILHANSIEIIDRRIEGFCSKSDWLISLRELDLIGVVDTKNKKFVWSWGPSKLDRQHHPTLLPNGNILIYDNGWYRGFSRVIELNPLTKKIVWEYKSDPPEKFFSRSKGGNQRLPNGNTLITESNEGRVFEITKDGKVVWEFYNPNVKENKRATIYRMMRITNPEVYTLLKM